jgi:hypothetical protein
MPKNNDTKESFDYSNIIICIIVFYCLIKISDCRKHEIARNIMEDKEFRRENNIRNYEDAEEAAEEIMDAESENGRLRE